MLLGWSTTRPGEGLTHDQVEALTMGDRVAVLNDGVLQQCAPPRELYRHPANVFVAGFIGSPAMNLFALRVIDGSVSLGDCVIPVRREIAGEVVVGVRPEHLQPSDSGLEIEVRLVEELGADTYLHGRITGCNNTSPQSIAVWVSSTNSARRGSRLRLRPDGRHLHFFDADGSRIY